MFLAKLPSEILGQALSNHDYSYLVVSLWRCGDRILQEKLASGISYVDLIAFKGTNFGFPHMLTQLRKLTYLSVYSEQKLMKNASNWSSTLAKLPKCLETLRIVGREDYSPLLNFAPEWTDLEPAYIITEGERGRSRLIDMEHLFPALRTLKLDVWTRSLSSDISQDDLPGLPSTLTCLDVKIFLEYRATLKSPLLALPRSLRRLEGVFGFRRAPTRASLLDWMAHAPPQLESIKKLESLYPFDIADPAVTQWQAPESLLEIRLNEASIWWSDYYAQCWPRNITTLNITLKERSLHKSYTSLLPRNLTELVIWPQACLMNFAPADLPPRLRKLEIFAPGAYFEGWLYKDPEKLRWPAELEEINLGSTYDHMLHRFLPSTLTRLLIISYKQKDPVYGIKAGKASTIDATPQVSAFPPNLTDLTLQIIMIHSPYDDPNDFDTGFTFPLPESLKSLSLVRTTSNEIFSISNDSMPNYGLPSGLTSLTVSNLAFGKALEGGTPPEVQLSQTLTRLKLFEWNCENFGLLPRSLTVFQVMVLKGLLPSEGASSSASSSSSWASSSKTSISSLISDGALFESLPSRLTTFEATLSKELRGMKRSDRSVKSQTGGNPLELPLQRLGSALPHLTTFHFPISVALPSNFLRVLPLHLRSLEVNLMDFDDFDATLIPQYLVHCYLGKSIFSLEQDVIVNHWPPKCAADAPEEFRELISKRLSSL